MSKRNKNRPHLQCVRVEDRMGLIDDEVVTLEKRVEIVQGGDDDFFLFYGYLITIVMEGGISFSDMRVLLWIMKNISFNETMVTLTKYEKEEIKEKTGLSLTSIERSIGNLKNKGILIKNEKYERGGKYTLHPMYVWKGSRIDRKVALKATLQVERGGMTELEKQESHNKYLDAIGYDIPENQ